MQKLSKIWDILNSRIFGYIALGIVLLILINTCSRNFNLKNDIELKNYNISVLNDSITTEVLKNGNIQSKIDGFIANEKELKLYNKKLANQVESQKGKVISLNNIVFELSQSVNDLQTYIDEIESRKEKPIQINDSTWKLGWTLAYTYDSNNYDIFKGYTSFSLNIKGLNNINVNNLGSILEQRNSKMLITWGQKYEEGKLKVFAETKHPAFRAQLLEGVYLDAPKKKHWFSGFGVGPQIGMSLLPKQFVYIGIGMQYTIYQW